MVRVWWFDSSFCRRSPSLCSIITTTTTHSFTFPPPSSFVRPALAYSIDELNVRWRTFSGDRRCPRLLRSELVLLRSRFAFVFCCGEKEG